MKFILPLRKPLSSPPTPDSKMPPESDDFIPEWKDAAARLSHNGGAGAGGVAYHDGTGCPTLFRRTPVRRQGRRQEQGHGVPATRGGRVRRGRRRRGLSFSWTLSFGPGDLEGQ